MSEVTPNPDAPKSLHGGYICEIPKPHLRLYPILKKRLIKIGIHRYYGIGKHYFPSVQEDDNPIWNSAEEGWQYAWDDAEGKGRSFDERVDYLHQAKDWVRNILAEHFSDSAIYEIEKGWDNLLEAERTTWFGNLKQGD